MHPERSQRRSVTQSQRCPDCFTPFAPEDMDHERRFAWCSPCGKAMHLLPPTSSPPPPMGSARLQKEVSEGGLHVSWHTCRTWDRMNGPLASVWGTGILAGGLFGLAQGFLPVFAVALVLGGMTLGQGLRALWRSMEVVQLRVEGRCLNVRDGPSFWRRRRIVNGALVRRLRLIRERVHFLDRGRQPFQQETAYTLMADMRDGSEQVLAGGFLSPAEPLWLALELHRALDLAEPVEPLA